MERAKRNEEIPLLLKQEEEDSEAQRQFWEQQETERVSHHNGPHGKRKFGENREQGPHYTGKMVKETLSAGMPFYLLFPDFRIFHQSGVKMRFHFLSKRIIFTFESIPIPFLSSLNAL